MADKPCPLCNDVAREEGRRAGLMEAVEIARSLKRGKGDLRDDDLIRGFNSGLEGAAVAIEARASAKPTPSPDYLRGLEAAAEVVRSWCLPTHLSTHEVLRLVLKDIEGRIEEAGDGD